MTLPTDLRNTPEFREQQRQDKEQEMKLEQMRNDFRDVFCNSAGHRVLWHIFEMCKMGSSGFIQDPNYAYFEMGAKEVGAKLLELMEQVDIDIYFKILKEGGQSERGK